MSLKSIIFLIFILSISGYAYADNHFPILKDSKEQVELGKILYNKNCASCHGNKLEGAKDWQSLDEDGHRKAPPLNGTAHTWHHPDKLLHQIIKLGLPKLVKDYQGKMLGFENKLSDKDINSILAYIKTYWPKEIYQRHIKTSK